MRLLTLSLSVLLLSCFALTQERYLVSPDQDMIPLRKGESASAVIAKRVKLMQSTVANSCPVSFNFGYDPNGGYPDNGNFGSNHKQVMAEWFQAKASGMIENIYWLSGANIQTAKDSLVYLRVHNSNISNTYGPGHGGFGLPCQSWGYWINTLDLDQGVAAFPEDSFPDTAWHSTNPTKTTQPPMLNELWGLGGYPTVDHAASVNHVAMADLGQDLPVTIGQYIWISFKINSLNTHVSDGGLSTLWRFNAYQATDTTDENYPSRNWKFYEHDSGPSPVCYGIPTALVKRGWVARGGGADPLTADLYNIWYSMTVTTNVPPVITPVANGDVNTTLSSGPQTITYDILDCYPVHPESAGVASAVIEWSKGPSVIGGVLVSQPPITMVNSFGTLWEGDIPGQPCGTTVSYRIRATDVLGLPAFSSAHTYRVVCLSPNEFYLVDTSYSCVKKSIAATGTVIDTGAFFVPHYVGSGTSPKDDGTAGPYDIGSNMNIFGDAARYAWVGVNGAIALSKNAADTLDVSSNGFATSGFTFPQTSHHGRPDTVGRNFMPGNFIAPFWADFIVGDSSGTFGKIRYGAGTDPCEFIVEWDSVGAFDASGPIPDVTTFRVVLNKCNGCIEFQYNSVGINGLDSAALVGMQADSNATSGPLPGFVYVNLNTYPIETKPRNNWCIKFYPGSATFASDGWNLLSVSTIPNDYHKSVLYPTAVSAAFRYQAGYLPTDPLSNGLGLWLKFNGRSYAGGPGKPTTTVSIPVKAGWNMIGTVSKPVLTSTITQAPPGIVISSYFGFNAITGYQPTTTLVPGQGYWVKVSADGKLTLTASSNEAKVVAEAENDLSQLNTVTVTDNNGRTQTLYLGDEESAKSLYAVSELPPATPEFDARFSSGRMVEMYPSKLVDKAKYEYSITIATEAYPVRVSWNISHPTDRKMVITNGVKLLGVMEGTGTIKITSANTKTVVVKLGGAVMVPKVFALGQNYPNPFNPTTHFTVDVPRATEVDVAIYDVLGQKVATLLTGLVEAGSQELEWDGRDSRALQVPTGIYFVRMNATSEGFSAVHKIMLMK